MMSTPFTPSGGTLKYRATVYAAALLTTAAALTACNSSDDSKDTDSKPSTATRTPAPATTSAIPDPTLDPSQSSDNSAAEKAAGIPPKPTGATRAKLLRALAAVNPDIVRYEDKAIDAARNQCSAINGGGGRLDWAASQRFTYKDVTTTEAQGKQINQALKEGEFCKV